MKVRLVQLDWFKAMSVEQLLFIFVITSALIIYVGLFHDQSMINVYLIW